jgi:hypothetical protein
MIVQETSAIEVERIGRKTNEFQHSDVYPLVLLTITCTDHFVALSASRSVCTCIQLVDLKANKQERRSCCFETSSTVCSQRCWLKQHMTKNKRVLSTIGRMSSIVLSATGDNTTSTWLLFRWRDWNVKWLTSLGWSDGRLSLIERIRRSNRKITVAGLGFKISPRPVSSSFSFSFGPVPLISVAVRYIYVYIYIYDALWNIHMELKIFRYRGRNETTRKRCNNDMETIDLSVPRIGDIVWILGRAAHVVLNQSTTHLSDICLSRCLSLFSSSAACLSSQLNDAV